VTEEGATSSLGRELRDRIAEAVAAQNMVQLRLTDAERAQLDPLLERLADAPAPAHGDT
jgi:hypothetical protein